MIEDEFSTLSVLGSAVKDDFSNTWRPGKNTTDFANFASQNDDTTRVDIKHHRLKIFDDSIDKDKDRGQFYHHR